MQGLRSKVNLNNSHFTRSKTLPSTFPVNSTNSPQSKARNVKSINQCNVTLSYDNTISSNKQNPSINDSIILSPSINNH